MGFRQDLTGMKIGKVRILSYSHGHPRSKRSIWLAECECGKTFFVEGPNFTRGQSTSCGCNRKGYRTPNVGHKLYSVWLSMRDRCNNPNNSKYHRYGGRGIFVCERWDTYEIFYSDMLEGYSEGLQLDRINNDGNYEPNNVRWATRAMNIRNSTATKLNEEKVREIRKSKESNIYWAITLGMNASHISDIRTFKSWKDI